MNTGINRNKLKKYRTKTCFTLSDTAFLLEVDTGNLSRYENGDSLPTFALALGYHLLFGMPMKTLIDQQYSKLKQKLVDRSFMLIEQLEKRNTTERVKGRIASAHSIITNLNDDEEYEG